MANPCLLKGAILGPRSKEMVDREWRDIASRLNAHSGGARKTGQRWKRYWADLKFKVKSKAAKRRRESGTDGGPTLDQLTEVEKKLLIIAGEPAVFGNQEDTPAFGNSIHDRTEMDSSSSQSTSALKFQDSASECNDDVVEIATTEITEPTAEVTSPRRNKKRHVPWHYLENPVSRRRPRHDSSSTTRGDKICELSWVVELERRRVEAEMKLADAALVTADAARTQAEAARMQAEASRTHAEAALENSAVLRKILEVLMSQK